MYKTQILPFSQGDSSGKYYPISGQGDFRTAGWLNWNTLENYAKGKSLAYGIRTPPVWVGNQIFESSTRPRPMFNSCSNYKATGVQFPYCYASKHYNPYYSTKYYYAWYWMDSIPAGSNQTPMLSGSDWSVCDGAQRRAWWSMQPRFEGEVDALNFLFELKDFKQIAKAAGRFNYRKMSVELSKLKSWTRRQLREIKSKNLGRNLYDLFNAGTMTVAQGHLIKAFAIDPTVSDCLAIHAQAGTLVDEVQQSFFDRGLTRQKSNYRELINETDSTTVGTKNNYWKSTGDYSSLTFNATIEYQYDYKMRAYVDALKRYYGLNVNAEVIWNTLPFSFVCDYVYKVANALRNMRTDPNVDMRTLQYSESLMETSSSGVHNNGDSRLLVWHSPSQKSVYGNVSLISGYEATHYLRRVTHPNKGVALPRVSLPSNRQIKNLVALARVLW